MAITPPVVDTEISVSTFGKPVADWINANTATAWTAPTLKNNWVDYGGPYEIAQYRKMGDMVQLRGLIKNGTIGTVALTMPVGFRSPRNVQVTTQSGGQYGWFEVNTNGDIYIASGVTAAFNIGCSYSILP